MNDLQAPPVLASVPPPAELDLVGDETRYADSLRRERPGIWWGTLVGPPLITLTMLASLVMTRGLEWVLQLLATALVTFFGLGRFVILLGKGGAGIHPETAEEALHRARFAFMTATELAVMVTWMDLFIAVMLVFHAGFLYRIPKLGPALVRVREEGEFFMKYQPWMRRFTFLGLTLFVVIPVAATGSVGGAIFGRLLGMTRAATLAAIVAGTLIGNGLVYLVGRPLIALVPFFDPSNPLNLLAGAGLIALIVALLGWRYKKLKQQVMAPRPIQKAA